MPMNDDEYNIQASTFLAQLTPEQRADLSERALKFGKRGVGAAEDMRRAVRPMARDSHSSEDPAANKSFAEMFPGSARFT